MTASFDATRFIEPDLETMVWDSIRVNEPVWRRHYCIVKCRHNGISSKSSSSRYFKCWCEWGCKLVEERAGGRENETAKTQAPPNLWVTIPPPIAPHFSPARRQEAAAGPRDSPTRPPPRSQLQRWAPTPLCKTHVTEVKGEGESAGSVTSWQCHQPETERLQGSLYILQSFLTVQHDTTP